MLPGSPIDRPRLSAAALTRWAPGLLRLSPFLASAYLIPGRVPASVREAAMLGVTSVNRCRACARVHERWGRAAGLPVEAPSRFAPAEAAAYAFGQALAVGGPATPAPHTLRARHRRELRAATLLMELANLAGNRFLPDGTDERRLQIGGLRVARGYDLAMRAVDTVGIGRARRRIAGGTSGDVLEIGFGTGLNLRAYPARVSLHGIDPSGPALAVAAERAESLGRSAVLLEGDAAALPFPDGSFDVVIGTFVLCSVGDVGTTLAEARRVLRPGGTVRFLEHARSRDPRLAWLQGRLAPAWSRASGGCRLDHDVLAAVEGAGLRVTGTRSRASGVLMEIVAAA